MVIYPPVNPSTGARIAMEMIFVLDCSVSMWGRPLEQAKRAVACALYKLQSDNTFQIIRFSNNASRLRSGPLAATRSNLWRALRYLNLLDGREGARVLQGIRAALDFSHDEEWFRFMSSVTGIRHRELKQAIAQVALIHNIMSTYTASCPPIPP